MKKSNLLLCCSAFLLLASCGSNTPASSAAPASSEPVSSEPPASSSAAPESSTTPSGYSVYVPTEKVELLVWCAKEVNDATEALIADYLEDNGLADVVEITIDNVGEGDVAGKILTDMEAAADVYFFAQDQLTRLVTAGAISQVTDLFANQVKAMNTSTSLAAGTVGGDLYAMPASEDNGYFLYYDGSKLTADDVKDWEALVAKAEASNYEIDVNYTSAWYNFGFFYGAGADSVWETNTDGAFVDYEDTYASAKGLIGARGLAGVCTSPSVVDNSSVGKMGDTAVAIVDGTWDYNAASEKWGANLRCAELPNFTVGGQKYHTGSFSGLKFLGVKPQESAIKARVAFDLAFFLSGEDAQMDRFNNFGWGPSNLEAAASEAVKAAPQLTALAAQNKYAKPQGQFPGNWWAMAGGIGDSIKTVGKDITDDQLQAILEAYSEGLDDLLNA